MFFLNSFFIDFTKLLATDTDTTTTTTNYHNGDEEDEDKDKEEEEDDRPRARDLSRFEPTALPFTRVLQPVGPVGPPTLIHQNPYPSFTDTGGRG